jgi:D-proline reductase (dithiol) PrdB
VGLVARHLEANGIPTVTFSCARDITEAVLPPRSVFLDYPLGSTCGRPHDPANQRAVILTALALLETGRTAGEIVDLPYEWSADERWKRLIFSPEQPFLSEEAEARRQAGLDAARQAKRAIKAPSVD